MRWKDWMGWLFLVAALSVGAFAYWLSQRYLAAQEQLLMERIAETQGEMVDVVVASADLPPGAVIGPATMALGQLPAKHVSARAIRPESFKRAEGHVLAQRMSSGEPLLADYVAGLAIEKFSDLLAEGERAVSLEARALDTHSGMVLPGDFVDLYVFVDKAATPGGGSSRAAKALKPVLERVRVLAAGPVPLRTADQRYLPLSGKELDYTLISVGVPAVDAEHLVLAREEGRMAYLLRNQKDKRIDEITRGDSSSYRYLSAALPQGAIRPVVSLDTMRVTEPRTAAEYGSSLGITNDASSGAEASP